MLYLKGLILIVLIGITWQDYKFRAVYWWFFLLLIVGLGAFKSITVGVATMALDFGYNLIFLTVQFVLLFVYFGIKQGKPVNIFINLFGLGDLFFLISIAAYFSLFNFITYYVASLCFVVILSFVKELFIKAKNKKIPLAGEQSILLAALLLATQFNLTIDTWFINNFID
jgi:hypothetical protein